MSKQQYKVFLPQVFPDNGLLKKIYMDILRSGERTDKTNILTVINETIPKEFITHAEWPKTTALKCHQCTLQIIGPPIYRPYPGPKDVNEYYCSAPCMMRKIINMNLAPNDRDQMISLAIIMCRIFYQRDDIIIIEPAPDMSEMVDFTGANGKYNSKTYRERVIELAILSNCIQMPQQK
jgi:hypothetical protein